MSLEDILSADYQVKCFSGASRLQSELSAAFNTVAPKPNWKVAINTKVDANPVQIAIVRDAIVHFTGSVPTFTRRPGAKQFTVKAAGYYATCGA